MTLNSHTALPPMTTEAQLSQEQQLAVELCCDMTERIVGVTGAAGTGKTLILSHIYNELVTHNKVVKLVAPTGRAAKRITELTGIEALTLHRLLEFPMPDEEGDPNEPKRNGYNLLELDGVIVDEASMLAPTLYKQLMEAMPRSGFVRFFGDMNQLPPIEQGTPPFIDILERKPSVTLTFNFRSEDAIVSNAARILRGSIPIRNERFELIYSVDPLRELLRFVAEERAFTTTTHQIIMPTRKGNYGTQRVNPSLQLRFNGSGPILRLDRYDPKEAALAVRNNDKALWVKNQYNLSLYNGEIGVIEGIDEESGSFNLITPDKVTLIPARIREWSNYHQAVISTDPRKAVELGYAITTHKAQGSEFDTVIYCIAGGQAWMLNKGNFYTAVTRAKNRVIVITDRRAMSYSLRKARPFPTKKV